MNKNNNYNQNNELSQNEQTADWQTAPVELVEDGDNDERASKRKRNRIVAGGLAIVAAAGLFVGSMSVDVDNMDDGMLKCAVATYQNGVTHGSKANYRNENVLGDVFPNVPSNDETFDICK